MSLHFTPRGCLVTHKCSTGITYVLLYMICRMFDAVAVLCTYTCICAVGLMFMYDKYISQFNSLKRGYSILNL